MPTIIRNARMVNEGQISNADLLIKNGRIEKIAPQIELNGTKEIDAKGHFLLPGIIDDQVHFRQPGLTHKADISSESAAAVAGGVTSFMDMPNVKPPSLTQQLLEDRYHIAAENSFANYSFYMGASNENLEEVVRTDPNKVCGIKIFMGSSTGNMLVDEESVLEGIFSRVPMLIATHCEDEKRIRERTAIYRKKYGENMPVRFHPEIRDEKACYISSAKAVALAKKYDARLHILHISTTEELELFSNDVPLSSKRITAEACVHHLWFDASRYNQLGTLIKCNPAIKNAKHKVNLLRGLLDDHLDVLATDHAPHTLNEKQHTYFNAPSGLPLVQHSLNVMFEFYKKGLISIQKVVEKMCHAPAICFGIQNRGYIREGYFADLVIFNPSEEWTVGKNNIMYKCGWSPLQGHSFSGRVSHTFVNGELVWENGRLNKINAGRRLYFKT